MKAWHFLRENKKLGFDDGRLVRVGHTFKCDPETIKLCEAGFHASRNIVDALQYAPGPVVCRVELGGKIIKGDDKCVASERTAIAMADASNVLHEFACWCAERALKRIENPDPRSVAAIEAKRKWLRGEITDKELTAARDAARAAARDAAWAAAWAASWDAARDAAWDAAWDAARDAALAAAWAAARDAALAAARDAERVAAWDAERKAQSRKLTRMVNELLEQSR